MLITFAKLSSDDNENCSTKSEAEAILKKLKKFETVMNIVVWDTLLQRLHETNSELQKSNLNLMQVSPLYESLVAFTQNVRDNFEHYEKLAQEICNVEVDYEVSRKKIKSKSKDPHAINSNGVDLTPRELYKNNTFNSICDALIVQLTGRKDPYDNIIKKFSCLTSLKKKSNVRDESSFLQKCYPSDLDNSFPDELQQFASLVKEHDNIRDMFIKLKKFRT